MSNIKKAFATEITENFLSVLQNNFDNKKLKNQTCYAVFMRQEKQNFFIRSESCVFEFCLSSFSFFFFFLFTTGRESDMRREDEKRRFSFHQCLRCE